MFTFSHMMNKIDNIPSPGNPDYEQYKKESHKAMAKDAVATLATAGVVVVIGVALKSLFSSKNEEDN